MLRILLLAVLTLGFYNEDTTTTDDASTTEDPTTTVEPCPDGQCCNKRGDTFCANFADSCEGEDNQNVREQCAKTCNAGPCGPAVCTPCNCFSWDGSNYSNCRPITLDRPCTSYCVQCEIDGVTPMPGLYTKHKKECEAYAAENAPKYVAITEGTCESVGKDSVQSDDDCKEALGSFDKGSSWNKQMASSSMYNGCFTATGSGKSYFVYDKRSSKYAMSNPKSTVKAGSKPRKTASADYTYYCYAEADSSRAEEEEVGYSVCRYFPNAPECADEEDEVASSSCRGGGCNSGWDLSGGCADGQCCTDGECTTKAVWRANRASLAMTTTTSHDMPLVVTVFAAIGLSFVLYGAFRHFTK